MGLKEKYPRKSLEGKFANTFEIGHNAIEFLIDFGQCYPENGEERFHNRVITCPKYAKDLLKTLQTAINAYEDKYGLIEGEVE